MLQLLSFKAFRYFDPNFLWLHFIVQHIHTVIKGGGANFSSCQVLALFNILLYKTNQYLIIMISILCQYISVHNSEGIKFSIWRLLSAHCIVHSLQINKMVAAPVVTYFSQCTQNFFRKIISSTVTSNLSSSSSTKY